MLAFGRQRDHQSICSLALVILQQKFASQYLEKTVKKRQELSEIALENQECTQPGARKKYDKGKKTSNITPGDWVLINMKYYSYTF